MIFDHSPRTARPPVFDDPRGRRRRALTAVGFLVCAGCLLALTAVAGILYVDPHAPEPSGAVAVNTAR
ncbi:hypothetical protein [Streptomyces sp. WAC05374]|uniref:hypothetical protein n=1 Tax=Streptomyces sp. WAC05374 TaxID=2487420 RepID=UPI00135B18F8|nr:hypothetical protein [Streptomyces sp. WAC05374]